MKIRTGDMVRVIAGGDAGETGKVLKVDHEKNKVVVEGINMVHKHVRPSRRNPQGGRLHKEMAIDASNVMVLCPRTNKPTRIGYRFRPDGSKERFARVSGEVLGAIAPARPRYATEKKKA